MCACRLTLLLGLAIGLLLSGSPLPAWANDVDGDGVDDAVDVCNNTPSGTAVDAAGRPLADSDMDCDTDLDDFALFQQGMTGVLEPIGACCHGDGSCTALTESDCVAAWLGAGTSCDPNPCIPPGTVLVPAGEFAMGDSFAEGEPDELPVHSVHLDTYYIDTYEVTNQRYADALNWAWAQGGLIEITGDGVVKKAGDNEEYCDTVASASRSRITWDSATFGVAEGGEDHPMRHVSWYGAVAYCNWRSAMQGRTPCYDLEAWTCDFGADGYRLPTEAEWEKAAGWDPVELRHYRFGEHSDGCGDDCLDGERANYFSSDDPYEAGDFPWTTPVGFYDGSLHFKVDFGWPGGAESYQTQDAQSYYGCRDMSGNVREWCHDWYDSSYYSASPYDKPTGPASGTDRVMRGGYWSNSPSLSRSAARTWSSPTRRDNDIGLRCAAGIP